MEYTIEQMCVCACINKVYVQRKIKLGGVRSLGWGVASLCSALMAGNYRRIWNKK